MEGPVVYFVGLACLAGLVFWGIPKAMSWMVVRRVRRDVPPPGVRRAGSAKPGIPWFRVAVRADGFSLDVRPPGREAWGVSYAWDDVVRVCVRLQDELYAEDELYIFTRERPESRVIPLSAAGADALLSAIMDRGLFPANLYLDALDQKPRCWPEIDRDIEGSALPVQPPD